LASVAVMFTVPDPAAVITPVSIELTSSNSIVAPPLLAALTNPVKSFAAFAAVMFPVVVTSNTLNAAAPVIVVVPVPALCVNDVAETEESAVTLNALLINIASNAVAPTAPSKLMLPVPEARVRSWLFAPVPVNVELKLMFPTLAPVLIDTLSVNVAAPANVTVSFDVVMFAPIDVTPVNVTAPPELMVLPDGMVMVFASMLSTPVVVVIVPAKLARLAFVT